MKNFAKIFVVGMAALIASSANAAVVKYAYEARVRLLWEYDRQTDTTTNVDHSDFAGAGISKGDLIGGFFQYDTSAGLSAFQPSQEPGSVYRSYNSGATNFISYVDMATGLRFESMQWMNWPGAVAVKDSVPVAGAYASDFVSLSSNAGNAAMFSNASLFFDDVFGNALTNADIPLQLDLGAFPDSSMSGGFLRRSDRNQMDFYADLTSMRRVDVPEPSSSFLFLVAGMGLFAARRARSRG